MRHRHAFRVAEPREKRGVTAPLGPGPPRSGPISQHVPWAGPTRVRAATFATGLALALGLVLCAAAPAPAQAVTWGLAGYDAGKAELDGAVRLGRPILRVEFDTRRRVASGVFDGRYSAATRRGLRFLALAGFPRRTPTVREAATFCGAMAARYGPRGTFWSQRRGRATSALTVIEWGNETNGAYQYGDTYLDASYARRAQRYGRNAVACGQAAAPHGVGVLAIAGDGGDRSSAWTDNVFAGAPDIDRHVIGWTVHPYGPGVARDDPESTLHRADRQLAGRSTRPFWITEWGLATDDGRCLGDNYGWPRCMTYRAADAALRATIRAIRLRWERRPERPVTAFFYYQYKDQRDPRISGRREHYFGLLQNDTVSPKLPLFSTYRSWIVSRPFVPALIETPL